MPARSSLAQNERALKAQFGAMIRQSREQLNLTQEALATRARMHRTYLADIEGGKRNLALSKIAWIATGLELSLAEVFRRMERTAVSPSTPRR